MFAARQGDKILQDVLMHCHTLHPKGPAATPEPHPAESLSIVGPCSFDVKIEGKRAARSTDLSQPCALKGCVPAGPGIISRGSTTVRINNLPAARVGDLTTHPACAAPVPSPTGKIIPPGSTSVRIGG